MNYGNSKESGLAWWKELHGDSHCHFASPFAFRLVRIEARNCRLRAVRRNAVHEIYSGRGCIFGEAIFQALESVDIEISDAADGEVYVAYERLGLPSVAEQSEPS